jgi:hypothetical protein
VVHQVERVPLVPLAMRKATIVSTGSRSRKSAAGRSSSMYALGSNEFPKNTSTQTDLGSELTLVRHDHGLPHKMLVQSVHQFSTTREQSDECDFFRVESLMPPRCITIPTRGGVGDTPMNNMSLLLLTKTSLDTHAIEELRKRTAEAPASPRKNRVVSPNSANARRSGIDPHHTYSGGARENTDMGMTPFSAKQAALSRLPQRPPSIGSAPATRPSSSRMLSASHACPPTSTASDPNRVSSARQRVGRLPPAVYH